MVLQIFLKNALSKVFFDELWTFTELVEKEKMCTWS